MQLFDVYNKYPFNLIKADGLKLWDDQGNCFLDFYGGHGVISLGHNHPQYVNRLKKQLDAIGFYSNAVEIKLQEELADKMGRLSSYDDYQLFLCNSGAEANENALKIASFATGRKKVVALQGAFHGRTSGAVATTDIPTIQAPYNKGHEVIFVPINDTTALENALKDREVCAFIIEGIQGVNGVIEPEASYFQQAKELCSQYGTLMIIDEIQSGYGRTGYFFSHDEHQVKADIVTMAKGMGNGFPIAGVLISPEIEAKKGMLGTTFGGNHLACAAGIGVLDGLQLGVLIPHAKKIGAYLKKEIEQMEGVTEVRGKGLLLGIVLEKNMPEIRNELLLEHHIFTGASHHNILRLLPPLSITQKQATFFVKTLAKVLAQKIS